MGLNDRFYVVIWNPLTKKCHSFCEDPLMSFVAPEEAVPEDTCRSYLIAIGNVSLSEYMSGRIPI